MENWKPSWQLELSDLELIDNSNFFNYFMMNQEPNSSQYSAPRDFSNPVAITSNTMTSASTVANTYYTDDIQRGVVLDEKTQAPLPQILSFGCPDDDSLGGCPNVSQGFISSDFDVAYAEGSRSTVRSKLSPQQAQYHIMAERRRRERFTQSLLALSAVIPNLKKIDKLSILEEATNYVKELQEKLKKLEEQNKKTTIESFVLVKQTQVTADNFISPTSSTMSSDMSLDGKASSNDTKLPEVEIKMSGKTILIRILCEGHKGTLVTVLKKLERFHLVVLNTSVIPFVGSTLDITIVAQMEEDYCIVVTDLVNNLNSTLCQG